MSVPSKTGFAIGWDQDGERLYHTGVSRGVVYVKNAGAYGPAVPWSGLTSVEESPSGAEANPFYADDIKYLNILSKEEYGATIGAYTYPDEFGECDGSMSIAKGVRIGQQTRKEFGFCYTTRLGNDEDGEDYGYIIHLIYGCKAAPSSRSHNTMNESPEPGEFSWEISTTPIEVSKEGAKPTASLEINSTEVDADKLAILEETLFGKGDTPGRFLTPDEVAAIIDPTSVTPSVNFSVDSTNVVAGGASVDLSTLLTVKGTTNTVTWTSTDTQGTYITMTSAGVVTGVLETVEGSPVVVTASVTVDGTVYSDNINVVVLPYTEG